MTRRTNAPRGPRAQAIGRRRKSDIFNEKPEPREATKAALLELDSLNTLEDMAASVGGQPERISITFKLPAVDPPLRKLPWKRTRAWSWACQLLWGGSD